MSALPERQALDHARRRPRGADFALSMALSEGEYDVVGAYDAVVRSRAAVFDEVAARTRVPRDAQGGEVRQAWLALVGARQRLANLVVRATEGQLPAMAEALAEAQSVREEAERRLVERSGSFRAAGVRARASAATLAGQLPPSTALVSFVRFERTAMAGSDAPASRPPIRPRAAYAAFVLTPGGRPPVLVSLGGAAALDQAVTDWRRAVASAAPAADLRVLGVRLRRLLWDPLETHVAGADRVFLVPDGTITLVPLAALPTRSGRYLVETGPVLHQLSAERDLIPDDSLPAATSGLLAVGGPAFSAAGRTTGMVQREPPVASARLRQVESNCDGLGAARFENLPMSRAEAEGIGALWSRLGGGPAGIAATLVSDQATEAAFKAQAVGRRVLHIATHGYFLGGDCRAVGPGTRAVGGLASATEGARRAVAAQLARESPLLLSGLAFAGANRRAQAPADGDDGILTAEEIVSLDLQGTEWAVLSACDTGLGTLAAGEGVLGLRRAFQIAGARTVIMSLWSVDDQATRQWMHALYKGRLEDKLSTADAVRNASLTVLRDRRARGLSTHPFYWGAFVAAGDWR